MWRTSLAMILALASSGALAQFSHSAQAQPPFEEATVYAGQHYSSSCRHWDDDRDGVSNCHDACPASVPHEVVGVNGCAQPRTLSLPTVSFASGSASLDLPAKHALNDAAVALAKYPHLQFLVAGHTDDQGSERANLELSQRRAEAVVAYLQARGISPAGRVWYSARGEYEPIASNETLPGRAANRRVGFEFIVPTPAPVHYHGDRPCGCYHPPGEPADAQSGQEDAQIGHDHEGHGAHADPVPQHD